MKDQKIRRPMYSKEGMGRLVRWFFGLPLIFIIYVILSMVMPHGQADQRIMILFNIISYIAFIAVTVVVVVRFLKFPFMKMISESTVVRVKPMLIGFCAMFVLGAGSTFIWKEEAVPMADFMSLRISNTLSSSVVFQPIMRVPMSAMPSKVDEEE